MSPWASSRPPLALGLDGDEREAFLACLEAVQALIGGDVEAATDLCLEAYNPDALAARANAVADRLFGLGLPPAPEGEGRPRRALCPGLLLKALKSPTREDRLEL